VFDFPHKARYAVVKGNFYLSEEKALLNDDLPERWQVLPVQVLETHPKTAHDLGDNGLSFLVLQRGKHDG
jgi:hypothetical protein